MSLEDYLGELRSEDTPVRHSELLRLSALSIEELSVFNTEWPLVPQPRKLDLLARMVELSEDNAELDFSAVYKFCLDDADENVREKAVQGLWECDDRAVIRPLITLLKEDRSTRVRAAAAMSLRKFAAMAQEGKLHSREVERIRNALLSAVGRTGEELEVRRRAIESVAPMGSPAIDVIIRNAYESGIPRLEQSAVYAMGQSSDIRWLPTVLDEMESENPAIRYEAAVAGGLLGDESTVPHLIRLIKDEDVQVQVAAVQAVGTIGGPAAKRTLQCCLRIGDEAIELAAESALKNVEFDEDPLAFRFQI